MSSEFVQSLEKRLSILNQEPYVSSPFKLSYTANTLWSFFRGLYNSVDVVQIDRNTYNVKVADDDSHMDIVVHVQPVQVTIKSIHKQQTSLVIQEN